MFHDRAICFLNRFDHDVWSLIANIFGLTVPGWTSIVIPLYFLGGVQLLFLGVVGEYIGKIYTEVKKRPRFIIQETINLS